MIGLVLVTHGRLGAEFLAAMEHIVGPQTHAHAIAIGPTDDMEARRRDIAQAIAKADTGRGVVVLTDMFGGTPSNLAISVMRPGRIEVVAGVNLPMLLKLASARANGDLAAAIAEAQEAGRKYIHVASRLLEENGKSAMGGAVNEVRRRVVILNRRGPHARAAAKLAETVSRFGAEVEVSRGALSVSARSIMGLMMLAASPGVELDLVAKGADADAALEACVRLVEARFHED